MLEGTRRWFRRNRTTFAIGAGALGAVYLAGQYAWSKWLEARQRMAEERIAKDNLRRRFEQNQEDCTYTVLALLPTVREEIIGALPVEEISNELQRQKAERLGRSAGNSEIASTDFPSGPPSTIDDDRASLSSFQSGSYVHASQMAESSFGEGRLRSKKTKVQLWYDMKINSITRSLTLLYTLSLLTLLTRIQLNLLGRRTYLSSVVTLATPQTAATNSQISLENNDDDNYDNVYGNDFETNRKYLTFSWWLLHRGSKEILTKVNAAVKEVFGPINPREDVSLERLSSMILEVRKKVEGATEVERQEHKWLSYLLPPREQEDFVLQESGMNEAPSPEPQDNANDPLLQTAQASSISATLNPSLRRLLDETSDLIDSPTFTHVLTLLLNTSFSHLIDQRIAVEAFKLGNPSDFTSRIQDISAKCKLAQTLAVFCRQAHVIAAGSSEPDDLAVASLMGDGAQGANEYLAQIDRVKDLEGFAAVIYSSNFDFEAIEDEGVAVQPQSASAPVPIAEIAPELVAEEIMREEAIELPKALQESISSSGELVFAEEEAPVAAEEGEIIPAATEEQAREESAHEQPTTEDHVLAEPAPEVPDQEAPSPEEPAHEPAHEELVHEEPAHEEPAHEEPAHEEPAHEELVHEEPAHEEPAHQEPASQQPATSSPLLVTTESGEEKQIERQAEAEMQHLEAQAESQGFESAWEKALANEDGKTEPSA